MLAMLDVKIMEVCCCWTLGSEADAFIIGELVAEEGFDEEKGTTEVPLGVEA